MDNSPLNEAHYHHRRAEASARRRRYDDAIQHHRKASELLERAATLTASAKALESILLQRDYHLRQTTIVGARKLYEDELRRKTIERIESAKRREREQLSRQQSQQNKMETNNAAAAAAAPSTNIKAAVNRTMDDADSLLLFLVKRHNDRGGGGEDSLDDDREADVACKEPKDDRVVIEELQTVNQQLRTLVSQLCQQLEETQRENELLASRLRALAEDDDGIETIPDVAPLPNSLPKNAAAPQLSVMTDSSTSDNLSPFIFSPSGDLSPIDTFAEIKELPPLEMPNFDYEAMMSQLKASREANRSIYNKKDYKHSDLDPQ